MSPQRPVAPIAPRIEHAEIRHGETITDDYFWLRDKGDPRVAEYLEAENAYTEAVTADRAGFVRTLYDEMLGRIKQTDLSVPSRRGEYLYYTRTEEGMQYPIHCRKKGSMDGGEEVLLDLNLLADGRPFIGMGTFVLSDDQRLLAYTLDRSGFRQYTLHVKDLDSGEVLPDTAERVTSVAWAGDNKTLFLTTEDETTKRSDKLFRHVLGEPGYDLLHEETDELFDIVLGKTRDRKYLILEASSKDTADALYLRADDPQGKFAVFSPREKKHRYYPDHREGVFYIRTNKYGSDFAIAKSPESLTASEHWDVFLPHEQGVRLEEIEMFRNFAVVFEKTEAIERLRLYDFHAETWATIPFPEPVYSVSPGSNLDYDASDYRYNYQSLITPPSVFDYNPVSKTSTLLKQQEIPSGYDSNLYATERLWATARDGVRVPISIVYKKGFVRDGGGALLLYGYGSYGFGMPANFSTSRLSLLDRGVAYAIAHIRGGNELGEKWREDGMMMNKKNTFFDFIDCAEYLIRERWTSSGRLIIEGGSAGGLLMGAVVNLRSDLFRAIHFAVPFVDVMNTMMDPSLPLTIGEYLEWGDPNEREAYEYMKSYSPYDNLTKRDYPAMLVTSSLNDSQVMYWEPAKYVARLRTLRTDTNEFLLRMKMNPAGHGGASGRYDRLEDQAFEYAWMLGQVGIEQ